MQNPRQTKRLGIHLHHFHTIKQETKCKFVAMYLNFDWCVAFLILLYTADSKNSEDRLTHIPLLNNIAERRSIIGNVKTGKNELR